MPLKQAPASILIHGKSVIIVEVGYAFLEARVLQAFVNGGAEELDVGVQGELVHGIDAAHVVHHEEKERGSLRTWSVALVLTNNRDRRGHSTLYAACYYKPFFLSLLHTRGSTHTAAPLSIIAHLSVHRTSLAESIFASVCSEISSCSLTSSDIFLLDCKVLTRASSSRIDPWDMLRSLHTEKQGLDWG